MPAATARSRAKTGPGRAQLLAAAGLAVVILGLTFALGLLVGRQWARHAPLVAAGEPTKRLAPASRRSGLSEGGIERPQLPEKLTFYQTLTAPLSALPSSSKPQAAAKASGDEKPRSTPERARELLRDRPREGPEPSRAATVAAVAPGRDGEARTEPEPAPESTMAGATPAAGSPQTQDAPSWTVQVGAFKSRQQADGVRRQLADARFDAYVIVSPAQDGQARHRVRVGTFKTREEALRVAERIRVERSLAAFVTPK